MNPEDEAAGPSFGGGLVTKTEGGNDKERNNAKQQKENRQPNKDCGGPLHGV